MVTKNFYVNTSEEILQQFYLNENAESLQHIELSINPQLFLDVLLLEIRGLTIRYSSKKKRERQAAEISILNELEKLEIDMANTMDASIYEEYNEKISTKREELENLLTVQAEGAFIRARAQNMVDGEKPTKFFCALEKHNAVLKHIPNLMLEADGQNRLVTTQKEIEEAAFDYYRDLFKEQHTHDMSIDDYLGVDTLSLPKLSEQQKLQMEGLITEEELTRYLKKVKNNVSPGSSGYTNEFYKFFWADLRTFVTNSINFSYQKGSLSVTQKLGILTLIPKGG